MDAQQPINPTVQSALTELIRQRIRMQGPASFAWFMQQALYHPEQGYYSSARRPIGRGGDYFTNVSVGPLFGRLLAAQFREMWDRLGRVDNFVIVEQGAGNGEFARDALEALRTISPELFSSVRYRIIEPLAVLRDRQAQGLAEFRDRVEWRDSIDALERFTGIHFSNELLDALPVHLVRSSGSPGAPSENAIEGQWTEKMVDWQNEEFVFTERPIVEPELQARANKLPSRPQGYETEVNLAALALIGGLAAKLERGFLLAIDYGFPRHEFYAKHRFTGTLQCRARHRLVASPFEAIGQCDITAHVDWTSITERATSGGLTLAGFTDQHHFLTGIVSQWPELTRDADPKTRRALQTLLHPEMLGRTFQVLVLSKGVDANGGLSGLKFARDAHAALGG